MYYVRVFFSILLQGYQIFKTFSPSCSFSQSFHIGSSTKTVSYKGSPKPPKTFTSSPNPKSTPVFLLYLGLIKAINLILYFYSSPTNFQSSFLITVHLCLIATEYVSGFAKFRKENISFVISVHLSFRPSTRLSFCSHDQFGSQRTDFHKIWYSSMFRKTVEKKFKSL